MKKQNIALILVLGILSVVVWGVWDALYAGQNKNFIPVESIDLKISKAELKEGDNWVTVNNILNIEQPSATFLRVELGVTELVSAPARKFEEIRFVLGEGSTIKVNGTSYPLTVPSGQTSGLKIKTSFSIEANIIAVIFDVQGNLAYNQGNGYSLKPVVKEAIVEQVDPNKPAFREPTAKEAEAIKLAEKYLESDEALNATADERMEALVKIPYITSASCGDGYYCVYKLSTGVQETFYWSDALNSAQVED